MLRPLQELFEDTKESAKRHKTFIACTATAFATGLVVLKCSSIELSSLCEEHAKWVKAFYEVEGEAETLYDFLEHKNLREEFAEFATQEV